MTEKPMLTLEQLKALAHKDGPYSAIASDDVREGCEWGLAEIERLTRDYKSACVDRDSCTAQYLEAVKLNERLRVALAGLETVLTMQDRSYAWLKEKDRVLAEARALLREKG